MIIKGIKLFTLTQLIISLSYSMNNENNLHNPNQINNNINLQNNHQNSNSNNQNELLNRKRKSKHEQDEINDENNIENTINNISNTFTHNVSFHPSVLTSYEEFYNNVFEFTVKYTNKSILLKDLYKMRCYSNFSYHDFIALNNNLHSIIQDKLSNNSISIVNKNKLTSLSKKKYPILELADLKKSDIKKLQINNQHIINMVYQLKLLKNNIKIARDRLNYIALINYIGTEAYGILENQECKEIYYKNLSIINNIEEHIKSYDFTNNDFDTLKTINLINCNDSVKIGDDFKIFEELYNKLISSSNILDKINIVEQFYSMIVDEKKLFSIFNEILLRDKNTISIIDKLLSKCWEVQEQYQDITYGGVDLIHQTILNTIDQYFISSYSSKINYYQHSKNSNKTKFKTDYDNFVDHIFHSQELQSLYEAKNYLERIIVKPGKNAIEDIQRYKKVFEHSDYHNGYLLFDNLYKFLQNNLKNINLDLFNKKWVNEEKTIKNYVKHSQDSLFEKLWLSIPKLDQLKIILEKINYYNNNIQNNNHNNNDVLQQQKSERNIVINNFWHNIILDEDIFDQILKQNNNILLKLINRILDIKEVKEYCFAHDEKIFDRYFNIVIDKFMKGEIDKKHIKDTYINYLNQYTDYLKNFITKFNKIYSKYDKHNNVLEANNKSLIYESNKTLDLITIILNHLELRLQSFKDNKEKQKNIVDEFIKAQVSSVHTKPLGNQVKPLFKVNKK